MSEQDLSGAFDAPVVEVIGGREQTLPLLVADDLAALGAAVIGRKKQRALAKIPPDEHDRIRFVADQYNAMEATIDDLVRYVGGMGGTTAALVASMGKAGVPREQAGAKVLQLVRQRGWVYASGIAMRVTCLFGQPDPNESTPAGGAEDAGAGDASEPSTST